MATPKQSSAQLPSSASAGMKKGRGVKEKHMTESAKTLTRKHVEAEQETEGPNIAAVVCQTILEDIIDEAALQLYKRLLDRKCFSFAAYSIWRFVLSNVDLCHIRCDPGDSIEELLQEPSDEQQLQRRSRESAELQHRQYGHRLIGQQELVKREPEEGQQQESQHHAQEEQRQQLQQPAGQQSEQINPLLHQCQGSQQPKIALWTCEEMPQLPPLDNWAPGSLTIKSIPPSAIPVPAGKKGKKTGGSTLTSKNPRAQPTKNGQRNDQIKCKNDR